ncbi:hypothetical protein TNCV_3327511 [Trichonephila clavipes]|nr:hypothetical protein TNCV_3327511 [Trichonephila clavipes]
MKKDEMRKDEMRNEGHEITGGTDLRPPYRRPEPRVFRRPPYAMQLIPTSQENTQVYSHSQGFAVLYIKNNGFTLTKGVILYAKDRKC